MPVFYENLIFILISCRKIIINFEFHNGGEKIYKEIDQGKKLFFFSLIIKKPKLNPKLLLAEKNGEHDIVYRISTCF